MIGIKNNFLLLMLLTSSLFADALPPIYPGYSLSPFDSKNVRMKSEKVDIYYGNICRIDDVYEILNPTKQIVEKKIGFPFNIQAFSQWRPSGPTLGNNKRDTVPKRDYDFAMSLNGVNLVETDVPRGRFVASDKQYWYGWTCKLKPDLNIVKLSYHVFTSFSIHGNWEKNVIFRFSSDKNWPGAIDSVQVTFHFPENIDKRQILAETSPQTYEIKGKELNWRFTSFIPDQKSDIVLDIVDFKKFANILQLEKALSAPNPDNATKLKAAKFFASLVPWKGIHIHTPIYFRHSYYDDTVLPNLTSSERTLFDSTYKLNIGSGFRDCYTAHFAQNDSREKIVMNVMNRIGYFEEVEFPVSYKYIEKAKRLFREVVSSDPKNADAWRSYISGYYLIETGEESPCEYGRGICRITDSLKELVREAFQNCGSDDLISLWYRCLFHTGPISLPDTVDFVNYAIPQENVTIMLENTDKSWSEKKLSPDELNIFKKAYSLSDGNHYVLFNVNLDDSTQKRLIEILDECRCYQNEFCRGFKKLNASGK